MEAEHYEKILTVNEFSYETIRHCIDKLIFFMYKENKNKQVEYFRMRLKDSEKSSFAKDLLIEWVCPKQPERLNPEDHLRQDYIDANTDEGQLEARKDWGL